MGATDHLHRAFRGASGELDFTTAATGDVVLTTVKSASHRIYIEELTVTVKTSTTETITFQDTNGTPVYLEKTDSAPGANTQYVWRWPGGKALALGKNFIATFSGTGLAGNIKWTGHQRREA